MYVKRSNDEQKQLVAEIDALIDSGMSASAACAKISIVKTSYFNWKKKFEPSESRARIPTYQRIEVPAPVSEETITLTKSKFFEILKVLAK